MLARGLTRARPAPGSLLFIENVGNLVCPALFDLGEAARVVVMSVTEGADKPLKYPHMFRGADLVLINKIDLLPYVDFDVDRLTGDCRSVRPGVEVLPCRPRPVRAWTRGATGWRAAGRRCRMIENPAPILDTAGAEA